MATESFEKIFYSDKISKRERVELTLNHQPVDRVAIHEQLSYNPDIIRYYTGKQFEGFSYSINDVGCAIQKTLDLCFPPLAPRGTQRVIDDEGFVTQYDQWTKWHVSRPFSDLDGAKRWMSNHVKKLRGVDFNKEIKEYGEYIQEMQRLVGECVLMDYSSVGFWVAFDLLVVCQV